MPERLSGHEGSLINYARTANYDLYAANRWETQSQSGPTKECQQYGTDDRTTQGKGHIYRIVVEEGGMRYDIGTVFKR